jgi:hypothetical protein
VWCCAGLSRYFHLTVSIVVVGRRPVSVSWAAATGGICGPWLADADLRKTGQAFALAFYVGRVLLVTMLVIARMIAAMKKIILMSANSLQSTGLMPRSLP